MRSEIELEWWLGKEGQNQVYRSQLGVQDGVMLGCESKKIRGQKVACKKEAVKTALEATGPHPGGVSQAQWEGLGRENLTRLEDPMGRRILGTVSIPVLHVSSSHR